MLSFAKHLKIIMRYFTTFSMTFFILFLEELTNFLYFCNLKLKWRFVVWFQVTNTIMQKKSVLKYLLTTFVALIGAAAVYAQSCSTKYAGTTFQPKSGITDTYYNIDNVKFDDPSSESITLGPGYTFNNNAPQSIPTSTYTVTSGGLYIHCKEAGEYQFFTYSLSGLNTASGKNSYKVEILFSAEKQNVCSTSMESHNQYIKVKCSPRADAEYKVIDFGSTYKYSYTFTAASSSQTFSFSSNYSNGCGLLNVKSIVVTGCIDKKIVSENGNKVCAGEDNTLIAKGLTADTYKWEISTDGKATWTTLSGTESTITVQVTDESYYRCTAGGETLVSDLIRPVVCCSVAGKREEQLKVDFKSSALNIGSRVGFGQLDDQQSRQITSTYNYATSGNVVEGSYAIVNKSYEINGCTYWRDSAIEDHTEGGSNPKDGFLLVNCGKDAKSMFEYIIETGSLCQNTVYDFSAFIANIDPVAEHEPVNAGFLVYGMNGNTLGEILVDTETGDLPYSGQWVEKGESFNSKEYTKFKLVIRNNHKSTSTGSTVIGNDIGVDDITFSTCTPEVKIYTDPKYINQDTVVCDDGKPVDLTLEAHAVYDLTSFFKVPYYLFQTSIDKVNWNNAGSGASTDATISITVDKEPLYENGLYYRVWVGGDKSAVENAAAGHAETGCGKLTAVSDPIIIQYKCKCSPTTAPSVDNYSECPVTTGSGTVPIKSLVKSAYDKLRVYDSETGGDDLGEDFEFDARTVAVTKYYITNQKATTGTIEYCESERSAVIITVKDAAVFTVSPEKIELCYTDETPATDITFTASVPTYTYTWTGTDISATGVSYTLAKEDKSGSITVVSSDPDGNVCDASVDVSYSLTPKPLFVIDAPKLVCISNPSASITITVTAGSGHYVLKKNGVVIEEADMSLGQTIIPITDPYVGTSAGTVNYEFSIENTLGCKTVEEFSIVVGDKIDIPLVPTAPVVDNNICVGQSFDINATYTLGASESLRWTANGIEITGVSGTKLENQSPTEQTEYKVELIGGQCEGGGSLTITVDEPADPEIDADKTVVCAGTQVNITDSDTKSAKKYVWYKNGTVMTDQTGKDILNYTPTETATYYKESINGACKEKSNEVRIEVQPAIEFTLEPVDKKICVGEEVTIKMSGYPSGAELMWTDKATGEVLSNEATAVVKPDATTVYTATVTKVCEASKDLTVTVLPPIDPDISDDVTICEGGKTALTVTGVGVTKVSWSPVAGLDDATKATVEASPAKTTTYKATVSNGVCEDSKEVTVTVSPLPRFDYIKELESETCTTRGVEVAGKGGVPPYLFSDNGTEFTPSNEFYGLPSGYVKFYIKDDNKCESDTMVHFDPYPINPDRYFTPNDDGINELWQVENLNCYEGYIVEIFDRYGRRLYLYKKGSFSGGTVTDDFTGWDGNYNGHQMPSTDYWYVITVEEIRKQYSGHFTLKR